MLAYFRQGIAALREKWGVWITPLIIIEPNTNVEWRSRLFASLMLLTAIALTFAVLFLLIISQLTYVYRPGFYGLTISLAIVTFAYWLSRHGYFRAGLGIVVAAGCVIIFGVCFYTKEYNTFYFLPVTLLFASPFVSVRWSLMLALLQASLMLVFPLVVPQVSLSEIIEEPGIFAAVSLFIIVTTTAYRNHLERQRQAHLVELIEERDTVQETLAQMVAEMEQQARLLDSVLSSTTDLIGVFNRAGGLTYVNLTGIALFDFDLERLIDRRPLDVNTMPVNQTTWETLDNALHQAFADGQTLMIELPAATAADPERLNLYETIISPIHSSDNQITSVVVVARDITVRKQQEAEKLKLALEQERIHLMSRFFQAISHDFRTSLSVIEANRYLVSSELTENSNDKTRKRLAYIQDSVHRMNSQIENLSVLSSITQQRNTLFDLNTVVRSAVNLQMPGSKHKRQQLIFEPQAKLPQVVGTANEIHRAVEFLINNAVNFTGEDGIITVRTYVQPTHENPAKQSTNGNGVGVGDVPRAAAHTAVGMGGHMSEIAVEVRDTGIGIPPEHHQAIFDLFYRVDSARSLDSGGIGIGLSIAQVIVNLHGGRITVASQPGIGSTFTLFLPTSGPVIL